MRAWFQLPRSIAGKVIVILLWWPFALPLALLIGPIYWLTHRRVHYYR